ncbi:MAG: glycosyltransferase family 39 protein [Planctomycetota bacterium]|nr:glycosyltransferase family 39 protein [Planctomycetota bacterium]
MRGPITEASASDGFGPGADGGIRPFNGRHLGLLVLLTLVAVGLRLFRLGDWSFWVDEAHTFRDVTASDEEFWRSNVSNYPLGYLLLRWLLDAGILRMTGEGWLRLPFAFFGALAIPALAVFARSVVGRRAALLAAGMLAISPWHLYWSQNARGYALTMFLALLAAFTAHRAARHRSVLLALVAIAGVGVAGAAHPSGVLMAAALAAFFAGEVARDPALRRRATRLPALIAVGLGVAGAAVWVGPTVLHAAREKPDFSAIHLAQTFGWFLGPPFVVAALGGSLAMMLRAPRREASFLIAWLLVPLLALAVVGSTSFKVTAQYGLVVLPAVYLLASRLIVELADEIRERSTRARLLRWSLPFVLMSSLASEAFLYFAKRHGERPLWREAAQYVVAQAKGPIEIWSTNEPSIRFYLDRLSFWGESRAEIHIDGIAPWLFRDAGGGGAWFEQAREEAEEAGRELYFVLTEPELEEWDRDGAFDRALRRGAHQIARYPCWVGPKDMTVVVYRVPARD